MFSFNHFNFNVSDLDKSLTFYKEALGLEPVRRKEAEDGSFVIQFLGDGKTDFRLELTWLRDHPQKYDLGECEFNWLCGRRILRLPIRSTRRWAASALRTRLWASISSATRMGTGSRSSPHGDKKSAAEHSAADRIFYQTRVLK